MTIGIVSFLNLSSSLPNWIQNRAWSLFEGVDSTKNDLPKEEPSSDKKKVEFSKFPIDVVKIITATFKYEEVIRLFFVSKEFHQIFSHNTIWEKFLRHICYYDKQKEIQQIPDLKSMFSDDSSHHSFAIVLTEQIDRKNQLDNLNVNVFDKKLLGALFEPINDLNYYHFFQTVAQHYLNQPLSKKMRNSNFGQLNDQLFIQKYELSVEGIRKIWRLTYFSTRHCGITEYLKGEEKKRRRDEEEAERRNTRANCKTPFGCKSALFLLESFFRKLPILNRICQLAKKQTNKKIIEFASQSEFCNWLTIVDIQAGLLGVGGGSYREFTWVCAPSCRYYIGNIDP